MVLVMLPPRQQRRSIESPAGVAKSRIGFTRGVGSRTRAPPDPGGVGETSVQRAVHVQQRDSAVFAIDRDELAFEQFPPFFTPSVTRARFHSSAPLRN